MDKVEDKQKRVKKERTKLNKLFKNISSDRKNVVEKLLQNVAFMSIELEDLQTIVQERGAVEKYQNGQNQWGYKPSSSMQVYNATLKSYNTAIKLLLAELPTGEADSNDALTDFVKKYK